MRKAINENPIVQIGLVAVLGVLGVVVFMASSGGAPPAEEETPVESTASTDLATPADPAAAAPADAAPAAPTVPAPEAPPGGSTPFEAGKGLPAAVVDAYESGDVAVLLVMQSGGIEDEP